MKQYKRKYKFVCIWDEKIGNQPIACASGKWASFLFSVPVKRQVYFEVKFQTEEEKNFDSLRERRG